MRRQKRKKEKKKKKKERRKERERKKKVEKKRVEDGKKKRKKRKRKKKKKIIKYKREENQTQIFTLDSNESSARAMETFPDKAFNSVVVRGKEGVEKGEGRRGEGGGGGLEGGEKDRCLYTVLWNGRSQLGVREGHVLAVTSSQATARWPALGAELDESPV